MSQCRTANEVFALMKRCQKEFDSSSCPRETCLSYAPTDHVAKLNHDSLSYTVCKRNTGECFETTTCDADKGCLMPKVDVPPYLLLTPMEGDWGSEYFQTRKVYKNIPSAY